MELEDAILGESDIHWICKILSNDATIVLNRERLYGAMYLPMGQLHDMLRNAHNTYAFLTLAFSKWISYNSHEATLNNLVNILRAEDFFNAADTIIKKNLELKAKSTSTTITNTNVHVPNPKLSKGTKNKRHHRDIIADNLPQICDLTNITSELLIACVSSRVLSSSEYQEIVRYRGYERNYEFYSTMRKKDAETFERMLKIFEQEDTRQPEYLLQILKQVESFPADPTLDSGEVKLFEVRPAHPDIMRPADELLCLHNMISRLEMTQPFGFMLSAIIGESGMGKTSLVRKYVEKYSQHFESVIWIDAESVLSIESAFRRILSILSKKLSMNFEQVIQEVYEYFSNRKSLFVFDNVADFPGVNQFLPNKTNFSKICSVLLISRNPNLKSYVKATMDLESLSVSASVEYMQNKLNIFSPKDLELVKRLVTNLNCIPSSIAQTTALLQTASGLGSLSAFLETYVPSLERTKSGVWFEIADPPVNFTGRETELKKLHELIINSNCSSSNGNDVINVVPKLAAAAIGGLGGIGKTSFVRKYAWDYGNKYFNGNVIWINAESRDSIEASFYRLAFKLNIASQLGGQEGNRDIQHIIDLVYDFFKDRKCLFIFDNVENFCGTDGSVDKFLPMNRPPDHRRPYILMTSRKRNLPIHMHVKSIELDLLSKEQAILYLRKQLLLPEGIETERLEKLVHLLQYLPLALQQAVFYIQKLQRTLELAAAAATCKTPLQKYLELFENNAKKVLRKNYTGFSTGFEKSVMITWTVTLEKIKENKYGQMATEIIKTVSYFDPDNIDMEMLTCAMPEKKVRKSIMLLSDYSMIDAKAGSINVHRLVQQVIRMQEKEANGEIELIKSALRLTANYTFEYVLHRASIWNYALEYDDLIREFSEYGLQICARLNLEDEVQSKIFERTTQKLEQIFAGDSSIKMRLFLCRFLTDVRSKNRNLDYILQICLKKLRMGSENLNADDESLYHLLKTMGIINALMYCGVESNCWKILEAILQKYNLYVRYFISLENPKEVVSSVKIVIKCLMRLNMESKSIAEFIRNVNMEWVNAYGWENPNSIFVLNGINDLLVGL